MIGARGMWLSAKAHGNRFLLRQYHHYPRPVLYDTAQWLVDNGYAQWLSYASTFYPGITLTGKPW